MLWYGILGVAFGDRNPHYIYDYEYSMKRLEAEVMRHGDDVMYAINPGLHVALAG
jgi:hypothetical protein